MPEEVTTNGLTVSEAKTKRFVDLVSEGVEPKEAAEAVGMTLDRLRKTGALSRAVRELLERVAQDKLTDRKNAETLARARLVELMMQDEDHKVALGAARVLHGTGPQLAVQINNNLRTDPEVVESLKSLGLEVDDDAENE